MRLIPFLIIPVGGLTMFMLGVLMIVDAITTAIRRHRLHDKSGSRCCYRVECRQPDPSARI
jgi:hypothetical protein